MPRTLRYSRPKSDPPESILDFLLKRFPYLDRARWQAYLSNGTLLVNGAVVPETYVLKQQDMIAFDPPRELEPAVDSQFTVKFVDDDLIVVEKSGNIPVSEGGRYCKATLVAVVAETLGAATCSNSGASGIQEKLTSKRPREENLRKSEEKSAPESSTDHESGILRKGPMRSEEKSSSSNLLLVVHRLDKETSGLVCFARTKPAAIYLSSLFQNKGLERDIDETYPAASGPSDDTTVAVEGQLRKIYFAIVIGVLRQSIDCRKRIGLASEEAEAVPTDSVQNRSTRDSGATSSKLSKLRMKWYPEDSTFGKAARSIITPLCDDGSTLSLVKVEIFTGRTHQIRLHCQSVGCPILGDKMYEVLRSDDEPLGRCAAASDETYLRRARGEEVTFLRNYGTPPQDYEVPRQMLHAGYLEFTHPPAGNFNPSGTYGELPLVRVYSDPIDAFVKDCPFLKQWLDREEIRTLVCTSGENPKFALDS